jgi:ADP-ribose pyrophosphatase YjhB (NUDIX family)
VKRLLHPLYRLQRRLWRVLRPRTRGVKVMLFNESGGLLLVRHTYGTTELFMLPGGGVRPLEKPEAAAAREIREELGCGVEGLAFLSTHFTETEGKRDTVHLFRASAAGPVRIDGVEIAEARFFALDALPAGTSPATLRRIAEYQGLRETDGGW